MLAYIRRVVKSRHGFITVPGTVSCRSGDFKVSRGGGRRPGRKIRDGFALCRQRSRQSDGAELGTGARARPRVLAACRAPAAFSGKFSGKISGTVFSENWKVKTTRFQ